MEESGTHLTGRAVQGRRLALLALLASARGRPVGRDRLIALLWPETPTDRARHQLSDALYIVRSALAEDVIRSSGDDLVLAPDALTSDVALFEHLLDEGRLEDALELYTGPFLDGFHLSGSAEFEHWLDGERGRLGNRQAVALESLADDSEAAGRFSDAVAWWRRLAAHDPYSGRIALGLMRALEATGDRAGALQHARIHAVLLREEFDAAPDPDVTEFAERLRVGPPARPAPRAAGVAAEGTDEGPPRVASPLRSVPPRKFAPYLLASVVTGAVLLAGVTLSGVTGTSSAPAPAPRSVGVLPFVNLSPDPENDYFSDGLTEQILLALSRIEGLRLAARTSSFALRDRDLDVRAIGDTLQVAAVLEGSVRRDAGRLRVTAQLIDAATGYHIWSDEYDQELRDVFAVQDEIASAIAGALELRLGPRPASRAASPAPGFEAYDLYLRGLYLRNSLSEDGLRQAAAYFDRAVELEPEFALAYAAKASVVAPLVYFGHEPWREGVSEVRALAERALELDPTLGEAHVALGILKLFFEWDWAGAEAALTRALELNPNDPHAYHHLANYLSAVGRLTDAAAARERAVQLDPLNPRTRVTLAGDHARTGDYEAAIAEYRRAFQSDPVNPLLLGLGPGLPGGIASVYLLQDRPDDAVEELIKTAMLRGASASEVAALRDGYESLGMSGFWRSWLDMDLRQSGGDPDPLRLAMLWASVGDTTQTLHWLERAYQTRNPGLIYLRREPSLTPLLSHPRVRKILEGMRLEDRGP